MSIINNTSSLQALLSKVNTLPTVSVPSISVNSNGLITATAGTKTSTHQLAFQAAKTITPTATSQTAVSSGYYTGGSVTVKGDSNLVAGNIKSGVSIFGVNGTYAGSGGDTSVEDSIISRTISGAYINDRVTSIGSYAFGGCTNLTTANFPNVTTIDDQAFSSCTALTTVSFPNATTINDHAFYGCTNLTTASFPNATTIGRNAFYYCIRLTTASFPKATSIGSYAFCSCTNLTAASFPNATTIGGYAFSSCTNLTAASFPNATTIGSYAFCSCTTLTTVSFSKAKTIGSYAFRNCYNLRSLYLTGFSVCTLSNSNAFASTPIGGYSASSGFYGIIYVPASLLTSYKTATNWTYFSSRFAGM